MNKDKIVTIVFVFIVALVIAAHQYFHAHLESNLKSVEIDCLLHKNPCKLQYRSIEAVVHIEDSISALKPFKVQITDMNGSIKNASVRFSMKKMDMGYNSFNFSQLVNGEWLANAVLPVCTAGRSDWLMELVLESENDKALFSFVIEV